jgi:hypothetical protein
MANAMFANLQADCVTTLEFKPFLYKIDTEQPANCAAGKWQQGSLSTISE